MNERAFPASIAYGVIESATMCLGGAMKSSAEVCLGDARKVFERAERFDLAAKRALKSIAYSRGVFSVEYKSAALAIEDGEAGVNAYMNSRMD